MQFREELIGAVEWRTESRPQQRLSTRYGRDRRLVSLPRLNQRLPAAVGRQCATASSQEVNNAFHNRVFGRCCLLRARQAERGTDRARGCSWSKLDSAELHVRQPTEFPGDGIGLHLCGCQRDRYLLWRRNV